MISNYFKIALRNLFKNKTFSLINVLGLAIGLTASFLIMLWVTDELSFDRFHENADSLYIVLADEHLGGNVQTYTETPGPLAEALKTEIPEIVNATRVNYLDDFLVSYEDKHFVEDKTLGVDSTFLSMFSFPLVRGNVQLMFDGPDNILLTEKMAKKYFGDTDPIGKILKFDPIFEFKVAGVLKDLPRNSMFDFEFLVPIHTFMVRYTTVLEDWHTPGANSTYIQLNEKGSSEKVASMISDFAHKHAVDDLTLRIFPFIGIHTHPESVPVNAAAVEIKEIYTFLGIAILILVIACINFMNLSVAQFSRRLPEIGVKKAIGANRSQLIVQFVLESLVVTATAFIVSLLFVEFIMPLFNHISGKTFTHLPKGQPLFWSVLAGLTVMTGLAAGIYPALFISRFRPVVILKNQIIPGGNRAGIRKGLVVVQFTLSILFLISTFVVFQQLRFVRNFDVGYNHKNVISIPMVLHWGYREDGSFYNGLKTELLENPNILGVTQSFQSPGDVQTLAAPANWEGKPEGDSELVNWLSVHYDFFDVFDIPIVEGRAFSKEFANDMSNWDGGAYMINESAAKMMGPDSPVSKWFEHYGKRGEIIGVVKDFHFRSLKTPVKPLAIFVHPFYNHTLLIKIRPDHMQETISYIQETWQKHGHNYPFSYTFVDEKLDQVYAGEERSALLLNSFAVFAMLIACLGLFGLASFSIQQKTKEIGIRKVLGSSVSGIWHLFAAEYMKWVVLSNLIAWPAGWFVMNKWLSGYAYRSSIPWWVFIAAGSIALVIAMLSIAWQVSKAANADPVNALRYE